MILQHLGNLHGLQNPRRAATVSRADAYVKYIAPRRVFSSLPIIIGWGCGAVRFYFHEPTIKVDQHLTSELTNHAALYLTGCDADNDRDRH